MECHRDATSFKGDTRELHVNVKGTVWFQGWPGKEHPDQGIEASGIMSKLVSFVEQPLDNNAD
jgi:hypothetical protein